MAMYRILKDPGVGGGMAAPEDVVSLTRAEFEGLRARAESGSEPGHEGEGIAAESRQAAVERELVERERKSAEWERAFRSALRDREVATALVGKPLVAGAATQLMKLWREEFDVFEEGGEFRVVDRQGRPASKAVDRVAVGPGLRPLLPAQHAGRYGGPAGGICRRRCQRQPPRRRPWERPP